MQNTADWEQLQAELGKFKGASSVTPQELADAKPEQLGNMQEMELDWVLKTVKHSETHFRLLSMAKDKKAMRLTRIDDDIYTHFRSLFPKLSVDKLAEEQLKSDSAKKKWRPFCDSYKNGRVQDYNFGTLLRLDSTQGYEEQNTTLVPRIQFLAIEIARNREGANDNLARAEA